METVANSHRATVVRTIPGYVVAKIQDRDPGQCSGCSIASICSIPMNEEVEIECKDWEKYSHGEQVTISLRGKSEWYGISLAFLVPSLLIIICVVAMQATDFKESTIALTALSLASLYFFLLYLIRKTLKKHLDWKIVNHH